MAIDLAGAKKIGFKWAVWNYEKNEWGSVSIDKPGPSQAPSDAIFSIDVAIEMQQKGVEPARRGKAPPAVPPQQPRQAPQQPAQQYPQQPPTNAPSQYVPQLPPQGPTTMRGGSSFFSLPSPDRAAEQLQAPWQQPSMPQMAPAAVAPAQTVQRPALPPLRVSGMDLLTPAIAGGIAMGVVMGIPVLNICIPVWLLGGVLGAFLLLAGAPVRSTLTPPDAAKIGAFAGLIGAVVSLIVSFSASVFVGSSVIDLAGAKNNQAVMLALNAMGIADNVGDVWFVLFLLISRLVLFAIFGELGAVLYVKYGRK
ncbi:Uncharacterised protein [Candidatus Burarchaeum australiense]|nr:Uncharacterised protein [Candidatus Burarchaeum australiense]